MDRPHVLLHYEREFPYPMDVAFQWLTDYQDDDPTRTGRILNKRDVVRREVDAKGRPVEFEFDGELETFGQKTRGRGIVKIDPDARSWVAYLGKDGRWQYEYRVVPTPAGGTRLLIDYRFGSRRWRRRALIWLLKPRIRREIGQMWDGFAAAMAQEIPAPAPAR